MMNYLKLHLLFLYISLGKCNLLRVSKIKPLDEILKMNKEDLFEYLKESERSMQPTDSIEVVPYEHGTKIKYYHKNQDKPYKTRVYLSKFEDSDLLK
jgi:hypothetical protein